MVVLDIVIVSYQCRAMLRDCLESLREAGPAGDAVVHVVDNGSTDGTVEMVRDEFPGVDLTPLTRNAGFSEANNIAIRKGRGEYMLALNPDTVVRPGTLDHMLALMRDRPDIGVAGCQLELPEGGYDHAAKRSFPTPLGALAHFTGVGRRSEASQRLSQYRATDVERGEVDAVNGAFMLMRRADLERVGLFDEAYWMYMEDLDLCYRFQAAGFVNWFEPDVSVLHVKAGTSGKQRRPKLNAAFHYGMFRFYRDHYAAASNPAVNGAVYTGILAKLGVSLVASEFRRRRPAPPTG